MGCIKEIGSIGNFYGCLNVMKENNRYFWCIESEVGYDWMEIPKSLYDTLIDYEDSRGG